MRFVEFLTENTVQDYFVTPMNDQGGDVIWKYNDTRGIFENTGIPWIEQLIQELLGEECASSKQNEVIKQVKVKTYKNPKQFTQTPGIVVLKNGCYNIYTKQFVPHKTTYYAKAQLPVTYNPKSDCPRFKQFIDEIIPGQNEFYQEWLGYHLLHDYRYQRCVILVGDGDNGKSTLLNVQTAFLGQENTTSLSLYKLSTNRFAVAELDGKIANIAADIGPDELRHTGTIKMLTGGDWISVERKNRDPFQIKNTAKLTFSCNQLPRTPDETLAFFKRFIVIVFDKVIPKEKQDTGLLEVLTCESELSGIFNWALEGLYRALERGYLAEPDELIERRELYMAMSDPVNGFCNTYVIENHESFEIKQDIIKAFHTYCREKGFVPLSDRKFIEQFKKTVFVRESRLTLYTETWPEGERFRVWKGVEIVGNFEKTQYSKTKGNVVPNVPSVQGSQTQLEKTGKYSKNTSNGHSGQIGHEKGDED
jgi:putative DNA primase/helicase